MIDLIRGAAKLQSQLDELGLPNCIIGGLALQAWGEVRVTRDADFTVLTNFIDEEEKIRLIFNLLTARRPDALEFAIKNRVILGYTGGEISIDVGLGGFDFEQRVVNRAIVIEMAPSANLRICCAEDLIVLKAFANRGRDWADIESVIVRQGAKLNWPLIEQELSPLLELMEENDIMMRLKMLR